MPDLTPKELIARLPELAQNAYWNLVYEKALAITEEKDSSDFTTIEDLEYLTGILQLTTTANIPAAIRKKLLEIRKGAIQLMGGDPDRSYRAAYWKDGDREQALTLPEHAELGALELLNVARRKAEEVPGLMGESGSIRIGLWHG